MPSNVAKKKTNLQCTPPFNTRAKVTGFTVVANATDISSISHPTCSDMAEERRDMKHDEDTAYEELPRYVIIICMDNTNQGTLGQPWS